jgi:alpha-glucosidase
LQKDTPVPLQNQIPRNNDPDFRAEPDWWRTAVVYQAYIRSFADGDGDGIGDIAGLRARIPYLAQLGIDALWINPWYPSPQADAGYDVADYRDIEPAYGTLAEADELIAEAHVAGIRVVLDIVPNHTSSEHAWFRAALAGDPEARARYLFRPGRGAEGELPPNDWQSNFGGPAWTRTTNADGTPGDWYLHLFAPEQPDLDWTNRAVRAEFEDVLRFWFDRGVDGFRIDVAHGLAKAAGLPDAGDRTPGVQHNDPHPAYDQDEVHEIYRGWRKVADCYDPPRVFVAESWVRSNERLALYVRPDELHTAFQFDFLRSPFDAYFLRKVIDDARAQAEAVGSPSTWVLSNHDVVRQVTRYARSQPSHLVESEWDRLRWPSEAPDLALGLDRARAAVLVELALPGTVYLYQGEELGLPEAEDIPADRREDPIWVQGGHTDPGRDGCRVPLPWVSDAPTYGFSPADAASEPWLPQPDAWTGYAADAQDAEPSSTLNLYRAALRLRRQLLTTTDPFEWVDSPPDTLAFRRGRFECWLNTGDQPVSLPAGHVALRSTPGADPWKLPANSAVWMVTR